MQTAQHTLPYPRRTAIRSVLRLGIRLALPILCDIKIVGRENIPSQGPLLIVGNHFSFLDPVAVIHATNFYLEFLGGPRIPNAPQSTDIFRKLWGIMPIRRGIGASSRDTLLKAQDLLLKGGVMAIFPEGGSWAKVLRPARPGTALLASRTDARVLPVGLDGFTRVFPAFMEGKRAQVTIRFGEPFGPLRANGGARSQREQLDEVGHVIMKKIAELIPPEVRGCYSDDPAVRDAARGTEVYPWADVQEA